MEPISKNKLQAAGSKSQANWSRESGVGSRESKVRSPAYAKASAGRQESKVKSQGSRDKGQGNQSRVKSQKSENKSQKSKVQNQNSSLLTPHSSLGYVVAVNISEKKGMRKKNVDQCKLLADYGLEGDAHAGNWHRQVSLLAEESIDKMRKLGLDVSSGDFAENITIKGIDLVSLPVGTNLRIGETILEMTQIGKVCHERCAIYYQAGDCVMPREGIFCKVIQGGKIKAGDEIKIVG